MEKGVCVCVCEEASDKLKMTGCRVVIWQRGAPCTNKANEKNMATRQRDGGSVVDWREQIRQRVGEKKRPFF